MSQLVSLLLISKIVINFWQYLNVVVDVLFIVNFFLKTADEQYIELSSSLQYLHILVPRGF